MTDSKGRTIYKFNPKKGIRRAISYETALTMLQLMQQVHQQDMSNRSTDQNFVTMMIHHHQMGNEMAKEFIKTSKTQEMKQLAQKTIDQQTKEIKKLEAWQQQNK
jgi:uncharacterized protein (DUF305 family)